MTNFPYELDTTLNLPNIAEISVPTSLSDFVTPVDTVITVESTANYPSANGLIIIDDEQIVYQSITETEFIDCIRGFGNTVITTHNAGTPVNSAVTPQAYTNLRDAVLQIQTFLGTSGENVAVLDNTNTFNSNIESNGILFSNITESTTDIWSISPTRNGDNAVLNISYSGDASSKVISVPTVVTGDKNVVPFSLTPVFDISISQNQVFVMEGNNTSSSLLSVGVPQTTIFQLLQDSTGGWTFTFPPNFHGVNGYVPDPTPNTSTVLIFWFDGSDAFLIGGTTGL